MKQAIIKQFSNPSGLMGRFVGLLMMYKNRERIDWAISRLNLQENDKVLEIGFGPGVSLEKMCKLLRKGKVVGVEISRIMIQQANKRNKKYLESGILKIISAEYFDTANYIKFFDKILIINVALFWKDIKSELIKYKDLLNENGMFQLIFEPHWIKSKSKVIEIQKGYEIAFVAAGFKIHYSNIFDNDKKYRIIIQARN